MHELNDVLFFVIISSRAFFKFNCLFKTVFGIVVLCLFYLKSVVLLDTFPSQCHIACLQLMDSQDRIDSVV